MSGEPSQEPVSDDEKPVTKKELQSWLTKVEATLQNVSGRLQEMTTTGQNDPKEIEALKNQLTQLQADKTRLEAELAEAKKPPKEPEKTKEPEEPEEPEDTKRQTSRRHKKDAADRQDQRTTRSARKNWI